MVPAHAGAQGQPRLNNKKVDRALREAVAAGSTESQRVIIRTKPGYRLTLREALQAHGDAITNDHPSISALSAEVRPEDIEVLAKSTGILSVSADAIVTADGKVVAGSRSAANAKSIAKKTVTLGAPSVTLTNALARCGFPRYRTRCARRSAWC